MNLEEIAREEERLVTFREFRGVDNVSREDSIPDGFLRAAENMIFDRNGKAFRRPGRVQLRSGAAHSLFPFFGRLLWCAGTTMYWGRPGGVEQVVTTLGRNAPCRYVEANGFVYFTNGHDCGRIQPVDNTDTVEAVPWALPTVTNLPAPIATAGSLDEARYQVAFTFETADGEESGTMHASVFSGTGATVTIPQPPLTAPNVTLVNLYLSEPDSDILRRHSQHAVGVTSTTIGKVRLGDALETQFLVPMPAGNDLKFINGMLMQSYLNFLLIGEPYRHGMIDIASGYVSFPSEVQMIAPIGGGPEFTGMFVADKHRTYFLQGSDPLKMTRRAVHPVGAQFNSILYVKSHALKQDFTTDIPVWLTRDGRFVAGLPNGTVLQLSDNVVVDLHGSVVPFYGEFEGTQLLGFCVNDRQGTAPMKAVDS